MKPKIYITHKIPEKGINMLKKDFDVELNDDTGIVSQHHLVEKAKDKQVILSLLSDNIDYEVINACKHLKVISNYAVGYNNIDIKTATERGIIVTNTPRILDETTADFVFALILSVARRVVEADKFMRKGEFKGWGPMEFLGQDVYNSTLGIIGMGSIGKEVARRGHYGFSMNVIYYDNLVDPDSVGFKINPVSFETLLSESDFISLNVPLTDGTHHLIGEKELRKMKKTAYLINTSRGPVVDENALFKCLKDKRIAGAAIDVFENEPAFTEGLEGLDNLIMTPHIASASQKTRELMSVKAAQNIIDYYEGRVPNGLVNRDVINVKIN